MLSPDHILKYDLDFQGQKSPSSESPWPTRVISNETVMVENDVTKEEITEDQKTPSYRRWAMA